jgi:hypothetical protein
MDSTIKADRSKIPHFDRNFFDSDIDFSVIGDGEIGGKASGLLFARNILADKIKDENYMGIRVNIPVLTVIASDMFDQFMKRNDLYELAYSDEPDNIIAMDFQKATLPVEMAGDLRALITKVHTPLAVRSSSLLEDAMFEPFAGIYGTKMIPNNQHDNDTRYAKLVEAVKFVYASTFFKDAKDYAQATGHDIKDEKMCVIIQEVVGLRYSDRYYPVIGRSYNFYPVNKAKPSDGVVNLALGLGRTIVDDGIAWTYSPSFPRSKPPYGRIKDLIDNTQRNFWSVNMGKPPAYDPIKETEYLVQNDISDADFDGVLGPIASTYDPGSDKLKPGISIDGPRIIDFSSILDLNIIPLNELIKFLLRLFESEMGVPVEMEFAVSYDPRSREFRFGFLQVRPMVVSDKEINITDEEVNSENIILSSEHVLGNGEVNDLLDIVFIKPENFDAKYTSKMAVELEQLNSSLRSDNRKYLLIGFGRWGSSDSWLGIPVKWGQISNAKVIVEAMMQNMNVELSQGSHFFHNITSFNVLYFSLKHHEQKIINWDLINSGNIISETEFAKHIRLQKPLKIKADGRIGKGIILV